VIKMDGEYVTCATRTPVRVLCVDAPGPLPVVALVLHRGAPPSVEMFTKTGQNRYVGLGLVPAARYANVWCEKDGTLKYGARRYDSLRAATKIVETQLVVRDADGELVSVRTGARYVGAVKVTE
jgi:hypothetical protein